MHEIYLGKQNYYNIILLYARSLSQGNLNVIVMLYICIHPECAQHLRDVGYKCNDSLGVHLIEGMGYFHELNTVFVKLRYLQCCSLIAT